MAIIERGLWNRRGPLKCGRDKLSDTLLRSAKRSDYPNSEHRTPEADTGRTGPIRMTWKSR
jgi:hypothetical protein